MLTFSELTYTQHWLVAFVFTQAVEVPIYTLALTRLGGQLRAPKTEAGPPLPLSLRLFVAFAASLVTHPVVWFVFPLLMQTGVGYVPMVAAAELFAVVIEALWLQRCRVSHPARWSVIANASSLCVGLGLRYAWGRP